MSLTPQTTNTISAYPLTANGVTSPTMIITGETRTRVSWARGIDINNGLLYVAPHPCWCYIEAKLTGFNALAPARRSRTSRCHRRSSG